MFVNSDFSDLLSLFNGKRVEVDFDGLTVPFICREDLIKAKQAAGRPQDLVDLQALRRT